MGQTALAKAARDVVLLVLGKYNCYGFSISQAPPNTKETMHWSIACSAYLGVSDQL